MCDQDRSAILCPSVYQSFIIIILYSVYVYLYFKILVQWINLMFIYQLSLNQIEKKNKYKGIWMIFFNDNPDHF